MREAALEIARQRHEFQPSLGRRIVAALRRNIWLRIVHLSDYRHLSQLDDYLLKDVGLSRSDVEALQSGRGVSDPRIARRLEDRW